VSSSNTLPSEWKRAVQGWLSYLRYHGASEYTLKTGHSQIRSIARLSRSRHPRDLDVQTLVKLCGQRGLSADHRHGERAALISFYNWCTDNGVTAFNPAALLPTAKAGKPKPRPAPDDVWDNVIASAPPRAALMALLACEAGLRRAEVACLHYNDLARDQDGWVLIVKGKGDTQRVVPVTQQLAARLREHCQGGYVFPGQIDGHISPDTVGRKVSRLMPLGWTMQKLRLRFATNSFNSTRNLLAVQEGLGLDSKPDSQPCDCGHPFWSHLTDAWAGCCDCDCEDYQPV
jgi:integrase